MTIEVCNKDSLRQMTLFSFIARHRSLFAFLASTLLTGLFLATGKCIYETNDDMTLIRLLTGAQGGNATPDAVFMSLPLSALLYKLYALSETIPFYGLLMYTCLVFGFTIGLETIFASPTVIMQKIVSSAAFLGLYIYIICRLNFTSVSLFLWFSVISAISLANLTKKTFSSKEIFFGCLLGMSYLIRPDLYYIFLLFSIPLFASFLVSKSKQRFTATLLPLILAVIVATGSALIFRGGEEHRTFKSFNKVRAGFTDTILSERNPGTINALIQMGWTWADHFLAQEWWFHDSSIYGTPKLSKFLELNNKSKADLISAQGGIDILLRYRLYLLVVALALAPLLLKQTDYQMSRLRDSRIIICSLLTTLAGLFLLIAIRFPQRVAIPLFAFMVVSGVVFRPFIAFGWSGKRFIIVSTYAICAIAIILLIASDIQSQFSKVVRLKLIKKYSEATISQVQKINGFDTIFLSANIGNACFTVEATDPLKEYRDMVQFTNFPMGWMIGSPFYNAFLHENGFIDRKHVVQSMINNRRLVLAFWENPSVTYEQYEGSFLYHLQTYYAAQFPGKDFRLKVIFDGRNIVSNSGWVYFTIQA